MKQHYSAPTKASLTSVLFFFCSFCFAQNVQQEERDSTAMLNDAKNKISRSLEKITEKEMNKDQQVNALEAIKGRVPGLTIQKGSNGVATLNAVRLRGTTSLTSGNDPLIIVDGVLGDISMLSSIFPADIESFSILKDASETAQYGSRGASGVIELKTKKGSSGKSKVSYSGSVGLTRVVKNLKMLSANQYRQLSKELKIPIIDMGYNSDFQKEIEQLGFQNNHHLAFYGGTSSSNYRLSVGLIGKEGVITKEKTETFTSNIKISQEIFDGFIKCELGMFGSVKKENGFFDPQKTFYSAASFNPTFPNHKNEETNSWPQIPTASQITNPLAWMEVANEEASAHVSTHASLTATLSENLKLKSFLSYTNNYIEDSQFLPTSVWAYGQAYRGTRRMESIVGNLMLNYTIQKDQHFIDLLALAEAQKELFTGYHTTVTNFSTNVMGYHNLQAGAIRPWDGTASFYEDPRLISFLGRINYSYADRYTIAVNMRTDGTSKFKNNKWDVFPAISTSWVVSEEKFMQEIPQINNLKISVGYGWAGNQAGIASYSTLRLLQPNGIAPVGSSVTSTLGELQNTNPDLKWEVKKSFNAGFDIALLNNRILFTANYYNSKTIDMLYLYNVSVPPFTHNILPANIGSMRNSGIEFALGTTAYKTKNIEINVNANISFQSNKLLSLNGTYKGENISAPEYKKISSLNGAGFHGGYNNIVYQIVGQPLGVFYLPRCKGLVADANGAYHYTIEDINGGGVSLEDGEDRYVAGQAVPKFTLGSNISLRFKQFDASLQVNGAFGHKIYNATSLSYMNMNSFPDYNILEAAPRENIQDQTATDYWLESGDFIHFDYLALGWNVPMKENRFISSVRLALSINNLGTITSYSGLTPHINSFSVDPTLGIDDKRNYPPAQTYMLGLSLIF